MLVHQFDVRRTARSSHEFLSCFQFFQQFVCFVAGSVHGTFSHFNYIGKTNFFQCSVHLFDGSFELSQYGRSRNGNYLFSLTDSFQYIEYLRDFEDGSERTGIQTFSTIDTLAFIDVFDVVLVLADGFHRTSFFTRHRNVDDGVIRTALVADTTADTLVVVNLCLTSLLVKVYSSFRTVHVAASCHTTPAKVTYFVVHLYTRRTCFVDDTENIFLDSFLAFQCFAGIFRKRSQLIRFIGHIPAQQRKQLIFSNGTFLVDTAASYRL